MDSVQVTDADMADPELAAEMAALMGGGDGDDDDDEGAEFGGSDSGAVAIDPVASSTAGFPDVPAADVEVTDADLDDPELAAEMAELTGEPVNTPRRGRCLFRFRRGVVFPFFGF